MMEKTEVAIIGLGTVGSGVARLLLDHGDRTARHAGRTLWLSHVVVRDLSKERDADLPEGLLTDNIERVIADPNVKVVAQLIGGIEPARTIMLKLLEGGKDIVTANKALLAEHGPELFDRARQLGRSIAFEASVAGGIPIITNISQCLSANQVSSLRGILNGTSNFVVTRMQQNNQPYETALHRAQQLGFAEADPSHDVDGSDSAQKLAILAHLGFGVRVSWSEITRRGIDTLDKADMNYAGQLGYRIKLIAFALNTEKGLQLTVTPMLVEVGKPLAEVRENFNAISVVGDAVGPVFFHGQGAGRMPTASAVVADMIDTAVGRTALTFKTLELWSEGVPRVEMADPGDLPGQFYLRFNVHDEPGVLGQLASLLGEESISIGSVFQHTAHCEEENVVPVVIMTRHTLERNVSKAVAEIEKLPCVFAGTERLRILD